MDSEILAFSIFRYMDENLRGLVYPGRIIKESNLIKKKEIRATHGIFKCNLFIKCPIVWIEMIGHLRRSWSLYLLRRNLLIVRAIKTAKRLLIYRQLLVI